MIDGSTNEPEGDVDRDVHEEAAHRSSCDLGGNDTQECGGNPNDDDEADKGHQLKGNRPNVFRRTWHRCYLNLWRNDHGGDFKRRLENATRASLAAGTFFSVLVLSGQTVFTSIWLGNAILHMSLKGSVGAVVPFVLQTSRDLVLTLSVSWAVNLFLQYLGTAVFSILLPFVTMILTFTIMLCPYLSSKSIMVILMWVTVQQFLHQPGERVNTALIPLETLATCVLGSLTGLLFTILPLPRPAMASHAVKDLLQNIQHDTDLFLCGVKGILLKSGTSTRDARHAISSVDLATERLGKSTTGLKSKVKAAEFERKLFFRAQPQNLSLSKWAAFISEQQLHVPVISAAMTKRLLGEEFSAYSQEAREARISLANNFADSMDLLVSTADECMEWCTREASACDSQSTDEEKNHRVEDLTLALFDIRRVLSSALPEVESILLSGVESDVPTLALLVRRMQLFYGLHRFCRNLAEFMERDESNGSVHSKTFCQQVRDYVQQDWPKVSRNNYRLPLKASVGMTIASLWVVIPGLYERATPFEYWPAITVASVNLSTTGSSYQKCVDRLWGTLLASAYALLLNFFDPEDSFANNYVKLPALTVFTFVAIYFQDPARPYSCTYAAISIGSILYGSIKNDFNVEGYISLRIAMIMTGILIFILTETLVFPKSSRKSIEEKSKTFIESTNECLKRAKTTVMALSFVLRDTPTRPNASDTCRVETDDESKEMDHSITALEQAQVAALMQVSKANRDLQSAFAEPGLKLSLPLQRSPWTDLIREEEECATNLSLLVDAIKSIVEIYDDRPLRWTKWPVLYANMIDQIVFQLDICCTNLDIAFPDGRIRPQNGNLVDAITASASFRSFEDIRLCVLALWSNGYRGFVTENLAIASHGDDSLKLAVTLGFITSLILEIARQLQKTGVSLETIARDFPRPLNSAYEWEHEPTSRAA